MRSEKQNLGEIYAERAMEDIETSTSQISIPKIREVRDMVYNGTAVSSSDAPPANTLQAPNSKKQKKRKVSPFTVILLLLGGAVSSVIYIGNILAVGHLMVQINQLQTKHQQIINEQELLKAQINRLSGLERIQQLANNQLGLRNPRQLPVWIEIDPDRIKEVDAVFQQKAERKR